MEFTFRTEFELNMLLTAMGNAGDLADTCEIAGKEPLVRLIYEDDTLYRELTQWASHAFACGLIERPEIERR